MSGGQAPNTERLGRLKESIRQDWTEGAPAWRKWSPTFGALTRGATEAIIEAAQVAPGLRVLDLASGTGEPAMTLAEAVAQAGRVTATDLVPDMLAVAEEAGSGRGKLVVAEENARARELRNIVFQQADAEALPFADASFDRVTCRFGVMFFPDVELALREIRRVLRPGGRAAFVAWGPLDRNPYFMSTMGVFMKYTQLPPPEPGAPMPFRFAAAGALAEALTGAGFGDVQEETRTIPWTWPGPVEDAFRSVQEMAAPGFRTLTNALPEERRGSIQAEILAAMRSYDDGHQVNFTATIVLASGSRCGDAGLN